MLEKSTLELHASQFKSTDLLQITGSLLVSLILRME